jgi:hypothetical protein
MLCLLSDVPCLFNAPGGGGGGGLACGAEDGCGGLTGIGGGPRLIRLSIIVGDRGELMSNVEERRGGGGASPEEDGTPPCIDVFNDIALVFAESSSSDSEPALGDIGAFGSRGAGRA